MSKRSTLHPTVITGTSLTVDKALKFLIPKSALFTVPTNHSLQVLDIDTFAIDGNKFEWWYLSDKYHVVIDQNENVIYLLQNFTSRVLNDTEQALTDNTIVLDRSNKMTRFDDFSGLIDGIQLKSQKAVIRVYHRDTEIENEREYVFGTVIADYRKMTLSYDVGFILSSISQLGV